MALKRELRDGSLVETGGLSSAVGIKVGGVSSHGWLRALGIAHGVTGRGPQGFKLALRLTAQTPAAEMYAEILSRRARGEIDIEQVGTITAPRTVPLDAAMHRKYMRPLKGGCSIAHAAVSAGSIGAFVGTAAGIFVLSNNHVLANCDRVEAGDLVLQPGPADGGTAAHAVGLVHSYAPLQDGGAIDAALCALYAHIRWEPVYFGQRLAGAGPAAVGSAVWKIGRTTGFTEGRVRAVSVDDVPVRYPARTVYFDDQIEIEGEEGPFSEGGDSGSLVIDAGARGVGLLFAGNQGGVSKPARSYANPVAKVLSAFQARLCT